MLSCIRNQAQMTMAYVKLLSIDEKHTGFNSTGKFISGQWTWFIDQKLLSMEKNNLSRGNYMEFEWKNVNKQLNF